MFRRLFGLNFKPSKSTKKQINSSNSSNSRKSVNVNENNNKSDFFKKAKAVGKVGYSYFEKVEKKMDDWSNAYNEANKLENKSKDKIFLFSAQHKDCIILSTILTAFYNSNTIIWRPNDVKDTVINMSNQRERDAVNMSSSLSLFDWKRNESANAFLITGSISNAGTGGVCGKFSLKMPKYLDDIVKKYYDKLETRYLCVCEFNDEQLKRYVRLSAAWGYFIKNEKLKEVSELSENFDNFIKNGVPDIKEIIKKIKETYMNKCSNFDNNDCENYLDDQDIQARILVTTPRSEDPYITHILGPNNNTIYLSMKKEIIEAIKANKSKNIFIGGFKHSKNSLKNSLKNSKRTRKFLIH
jgi:hypothetical protein